MTWRLTGNPEEFLAAAGQHLRAEPVHNTVLLTVLETLRHGGMSAFGDEPPVFGWHESAGRGTDGAFLHTPPFPVLAARLPAPGAASSLVDLLTADGRVPTQANVTSADEADMTAAWTAATGGSATLRLRTRLFRLAGLLPPDPMPAGAARLATGADHDLLAGWHAAFGAETGTGGDPQRSVEDRLSHGGLMIWEADGQPVAMAGCTRNVAGVIRVVDVYTKPEHRQRGYGGAITTAVTRAALDDGAADVVLFTDLANPTSNALYGRLGYRPVGERVLLRLDLPAHGQPTGGPR